MGTPKISSKEVIDSLQHEIQGRRNSLQVLHGTENQDMDDERNYANCAFNYASQNNEFNNNFHTRIMRQINY